MLLIFCCSFIGGKTKDFSFSRGPILMSHLHCNGDEVSLLHCNHQSCYTYQCSSYYDAGVVCEGQSL